MLWFSLPQSLCGGKKVEWATLRWRHCLNSRRLFAAGGNSRLADQEAAYSQ